jgi:glycosyltransferase involved in cell wall biosynthesis
MAQAPRLLFIYRFCGLGGVETSIATKVQALQAAGARVEVLFSELYASGGASIAGQPWARIGLSRAEVEALLEEPFDLIVVVDYPAFLDRIEGAARQQRVVFETHTSLPDSIPGFFQRLGSLRLAAMTAPARFNRRLLEQHGFPPKPFFAIPNPVDAERFRPRPLDELDPELRKLAPGPLLLWVGRLEDEKNPQEFLRVAERVFPSRPEACGLMVGDSPDYDAYRARLAAGTGPWAGERVHFLRGIPNARMAELYALVAGSGGCLVSTSRHEAQPMIFLEAMACGCPVVAASVDGVPDLVIPGETGWLFPPGDDAVAARAILRVIGPDGAPERATVTGAARRRVAQDHSPATAARRYLELIERVTVPAPAPPRNPLVSGITIFLNGANFLREAIESVLAQTYPYWELLLVDDGSTDGSSDIAREYATRHPDRIRYFAHEGHQNLGKIASRNLGLRNARGEYIALLDHDDVWLPDKLADQVALLEARPHAAFLYGRTRYWHSWTGRPDDAARDGLTQLGIEPDTTVLPPALLTLFLQDERTIASPGSFLIRREAALGAGGFPADFPSNIYDDVAFFSRLYLRYPGYVAGGCWDYYRQHRNNSVAAARLTGQWHPRRPNPRKRVLLDWLEAAIREQGSADPELHAALAAALAPYRNPPPRTPEEELLDASLDGTLAVLRGEDPAPWVPAGEPVPALDPQAVAEQVFDAVPESTWNAPSLWLESWPAARPGIVRLLELVEARAAAGLARKALGILEQLIEGRWLLRVAGGNAATLRLDGEDPEHARVAITRAGAGECWDIQLNRPRLAVSASRRYAVRFAARAERSRNLGVGIAGGPPAWDNLGWYQSVELSTAWTAVEAEFVARASSEEARLHFDLGDSDAGVEVAGVGLAPVEPSPA